MQLGSAEGIKTGEQRLVTDGSQFSQFDQLKNIGPDSLKPKLNTNSALRD